MSSNKHDRKTKKEKQSNSKSIAKNKSEYFLSFGCPLHTPTQ
jgi:hypothetical protein